MKVYIQCSNCGNMHCFRWDRHEYPNPWDAILEGWRSYSVNLYCPKCTETWKERNGDDKSMGGTLETLDRIWKNLASMIEPVEIDDEE